MHFKVTFNLDGTGVSFDPRFPLHLDALLGWCLAPMQVPPHMRDLQTDEKPFDVQIPLLRSKVNGHDVWHGSALFSEGDEPETIAWWRKRFRTDFAGGLTSGSPNMTLGKMRCYNTPLPLILTRQMFAYASGNRKTALKALRANLKYLGKKSSEGHGKILSIEAEEVSEDWSLTKDGVAMRFLPHPEGRTIARCAPPYWNFVDRVPCLSPGEEIPA
jgi:hypothetical protein